MVDYDELLRLLTSLFVDTNDCDVMFQLIEKASKDQAFFNYAIKPIVINSDDDSESEWVPGGGAPAKRKRSKKRIPKNAQQQGKMQVVCGGCGSELSHLSQPEHHGLHARVILNHRMSSSMKCCVEIGCSHFVRLRAKVC